MFELRGGLYTDAYTQKGSWSYRTREFGSFVRREGGLYP
jgi:hypothetical protein